MSFSRSLLGLFLAGTSLASVTVEDPSDVIDPADWAADNALLADYNVAFPSTQPSDIIAGTSYVSESVAIDHESFSVDANDTSVILVAEGATFDGSYLDILKFGYSSNLLYASFWGFNAAINVANASTANLDHVNITVHNGGANVYSYGTDTVVTVEDSWLYSSGPVSHGLYASGNGTVIGRNLQHYSGGYRSSSFSGDSPAGYVYVYDSVAHAAGVGSATYYALGTIYAENVLSVSEQGPVVFMDGVQNATLVHCDATAGLLGGVVLFSSMDRQSGGRLELVDSKITTVGDDVPGLWFGNTIVDVVINSSQVISPSGVLIVANYSQVTQDFDYYGGYPDNNNLQPAEVYASVYESSLSGDLVPYNGSYISFSLEQYSAWAGAAYAGYGVGLVDVSLSADSNWTLTADSTVQNLTDADASLANIDSAGFTLYYNSTLNDWLDGQTISLTGGGSATPA
ncbi:hypothetical protein PFICI_08779 [Pestalotiopsis fici W106-1]|uniref:Uncharacterized protein n=1 Tax=Pestalotiopsis fici (strain W106-1 / CGMCC3.15140) TaxID=1229662 RepID=W3X186_PESFW|nr:uncharacterized protein PFICI_08779 [Pestalotiopsis fici W106-1]ETS78926.1 hypothetical protein PFICI_08779 [Pestalotiopsis fici W106-1]